MWWGFLPRQCESSFHNGCAVPLAHSACAWWYGCILVYSGSCYIAVCELSAVGWRRWTHGLVAGEGGSCCLATAFCRFHEKGPMLLLVRCLLGFLLQAAIKFFQIDKKLFIAYTYYCFGYSNQLLCFYEVVSRVTDVPSWVVAMPLLLNKHLLVVFCEVPMICDACCFKFLGHRQGNVPAFATGRCAEC